MSRIESFIFLDFETTGIEREARITEIAVIAVSREHILSAATKAKGLPRVMNKFAICVKPNKSINPIAARISGLNNDLLQGQKPFDSTAFNILENFVCRLPQPICLIAHNGDTFDFPILQAELEAFRQKLPDYLLCADSMKCFRALFSPNKEPFDNLPVVEQSNTPNVNLAAQVVITRLENCSTVCSVTEMSNDTEVKCMNHVNDTGVAYTRAKRRRTAVSLYVANGKCSVDENVMTEEKSKSKTKLRPQSFKLADIYRHFFSRNPQNNHTAYGDAQNLLECIIAVGNDFTSWTDTNARKLSDVKSRWSRQPVN